MEAQREKTTANLPASIADDILDGAETIGAFTGFTQRQVYHLAATKQLPIFKLGRRLTARKSTLLAAMERLEKGAA